MMNYEISILKVFEFGKLVQVRFERVGRGVGGRVVVKRGLERVDSGADLRGFSANGVRGHVPCAVVHRIIPLLVVLEQEFGEVKARAGATEVEHGGVVGACGGHWRRVGAQPNPGPLVGLSNLRHPLSPLPHPYSSVRFHGFGILSVLWLLRFRILGTTLVPVFHDASSISMPMFLLCSYVYG